MKNVTAVNTMMPMQGPLAPKAPFKPCAGCPDKAACSAKGKCLKGEGY